MATTVHYSSIAASLPRCLSCKGQGLVVTERPVAIYGGMPTRFASTCLVCDGSGRARFTDRKSSAAGGN